MTVYRCAATVCASTTKGNEHDAWDEHQQAEAWHTAI
jgi:hypothetical protein